VRSFSLGFGTVDVAAGAVAAGTGCGWPWTRATATSDAIARTTPADREGNIALYSNPAAPLDPELMPALVAFIRSVAR